METAMHDKPAQQQGQNNTHGNPYLRLLAMVVLSFLSMYMLMYAMVDRLANVFPNFNQAYMAALMAAPMVIIELVLMAGMYPRKRLNGVILAAAALALLVSWLAIRQQWAIADRQFLKSMIPHHAGAILMCRQARLQYPGIRALCSSIVSDHEAEIEQMKALLGEDAGAWGIGGCASGTGSICAEPAARTTEGGPVFRAFCRGGNSLFESRLNGCYGPAGS